MLDSKAIRATWNDSCNKQRVYYTLLELQDIGNYYVRCKPANRSSYWNNATGILSLETGFRGRDYVSL